MSLFPYTRRISGSTAASRLGLGFTLDLGVGVAVGLSAGVSCGFGFGMAFGLCGDLLIRRSSSSEISIKSSVSFVLLTSSVQTKKLDGFFAPLSDPPTDCKVRRFETAVVEVYYLNVTHVLCRRPVLPRYR